MRCASRIAVLAVVTTAVHVVAQAGYGQTASQMPAATPLEQVAETFAGIFGTASGAPMPLAATGALPGSTGRFAPQPAAHPTGGHAPPWRVRDAKVACTDKTRGCFDAAILRRFIRRASADLTACVADNHDVGPQPSVFHITATIATDGTLAVRSTGGPKARAAAAACLGGVLAKISLPATPQVATAEVDLEFGPQATSSPAAAPAH